MLLSNNFAGLSRAAAGAARFTFIKPNVSIIPSRTFSSSPASSVPRILSPSVWAPVVPRFIRERKSGDGQAEKPKSREWNPATYFIIMAILIGSQAIRTLVLRKDFDNYVRITDAKIHLLREVIEKVKRGEDVDVRGMLGTGDPKAEAEWNEAVRQIAEGDIVSQKEQKQRKRNQTPTQTKPEPAKSEPARSNDSPPQPAKDGTKSQGNFY